MYLTTVTSDAFLDIDNYGCFSLGWRVLAKGQVWQQYCLSKHAILGFFLFNQNNLIHRNKYIYIWAKPEQRQAWVICHRLQHLINILILYITKLGLTLLKKYSMYTPSFFFFFFLKMDTTPPFWFVKSLNVLKNTIIIKKCKILSKWEKRSKSTFKRGELIFWKKKKKVN